MSKRKKIILAALSAVAVLGLGIFAFIVVSDRLIVSELAKLLTEENQKLDRATELEKQLTEKMHQQGLGDMKGRELTPIEHEWLAALSDKVVTYQKVKILQGTLLRLGERPWVTIPACQWGPVL